MLGHRSSQRHQPDGDWPGAALLGSLNLSRCFVDLYGMELGEKSELVEVFSGSGGQPRAEFLSATLEAEGIACVVSSSGIAGYLLSIGPMADFKIRVAPEDEERARTIIEGLTTEVEDFEPIAPEERVEFGSTIEFGPPQQISRVSGLSILLYGIAVIAGLGVWVGIAAPEGTSGWGLILWSGLVAGVAVILDLVTRRTGWGR